MQNSEITKQERKKLIEQISKASGVAQYALLKKMTDEQVVIAAQHIEVLQLLKPSNDYNRYCQAQRTGEANKKLKEFTNLQNSEILNAGKWLMNALSKTGGDRKQTLLERDLVHKEDYNDTVTNLRETITEQDKVSDEITADAQSKIEELEQRIDTLRRQQTNLQKYISNNYGFSTWRTIANTFDLEA